MYCMYTMFTVLFLLCADTINAQILQSESEWCSCHFPSATQLLIYSTKRISSYVCEQTQVAL